jgi:hypothetical protein
LLLRILGGDEEDAFVVGEGILHDGIERGGGLAHAGGSRDEQVTAFVQGVVDGGHHFVLMDARFVVRESYLLGVRAAFFLTALFFLRLGDERTHAVGNEAFAVVERAANFDFLRGAVGYVHKDKAAESAFLFLFDEEAIEAKLLDVMRVGIGVERGELERRHDDGFHFLDHVGAAVVGRMNAVDAARDCHVEIVDDGFVADGDFARVPLVQPGLGALMGHVRLASDGEAGPNAEASDAIAVGERLRDDVADAERNFLFVQLDFDGHSGDRVQQDRIGSQREKVKVKSGKQKMKWRRGL